MEVAGRREAGGWIVTSSGNFETFGPDSSPFSMNRLRVLFLALACVLFSRSILAYLA